MFFAFSICLLNHFEFILVYGVRKWSSFIFLHISVQFSRHHLLNRLFYPIVYFCLLCKIVIDHVGVGLFLGSLSCSQRYSLGDVLHLDDAFQLMILVGIGIYSPCLRKRSLLFLKSY